MKSKVSQNSKQTHKGVEPLRNPDSTCNSGQKSKPPDTVAQSMTSFDGPKKPQNGCELARELYRSCCIVQFFGVTAAVVAFLTFVIPNFNVLILKENLFRTALCCMPLFLAYLLVGSPLIVTKKMNNNPKSLLGMCWLIYFLDALLLGGLVAMTGGPSKSSFIPLFLLIPTAMSCYCNPKKWPFWSIIISVTTVYIIAACIERTGWLIVKGANTQPDEWIRQLIAGVFTISCIMIAAYCCVVTHGVRNSYCADKREPRKIAPSICDDLCFSGFKSQVRLSREE